jgi:DNA-binding CsgD family transcriptional regulator
MSAVPPMPPALSEWPLVGRSEELALLRQLRRRSALSSAVISGPAGVGKTRLAAATVADAESEGWSTLGLRASAGFGTVPFAAFRWVLPLVTGNDVEGLASAVTESLHQHASGRPLLVWADDGHDLDSASAALLHQLVATGSIAALVTVRSGLRIPPALTQLWKDGLAERLELLELSRNEVRKLLSIVLAGPIAESTRERLWAVTEGNPLYLREVIHASLEADALRQQEDEWHWRGEWAGGQRLREIVAHRIGRIAPDELATLESLAVAVSLPYELLASMTSSAAITSLERRELVVLERSGRRLEVRIAHPLHGEVLRAGMAILQLRGARRNLVEAVQCAGARRSGDRLRIACWSIDSGLDVDPVSLASAADSALWHVGRMIAARLSELLPSSEHFGVPSGEGVSANPELALRLARAAYESGGGMAAGGLLATTLAWTGAITEAELLLERLERSAPKGDDQLRFVLALADVRFWGQQRVADATTVLTEALQQPAQSADPLLLAEVCQKLASIELNTGRPSHALSRAMDAAERAGADLWEGPSAPVAAASLSYLGRTDDALELIDKAIPLAARQAWGTLETAQLMFARVGALARAGRLEDALQLAEGCRQVALACDSSDGAALFGLVASEVLLRQGRPASAEKLLRDATNLLAARDVFGYLPWACSALARALAMFGDEVGADAALAKAEQVRTVSRHFDLSMHLARGAVELVAGRPAPACERLRDGAAWAREAHMPIDEALALDAVIAIEPDRAVAARLSELAAAADGDLVRALSLNAAAVVAHDPVALEVAGATLGSLSAWWLAAEACARAALMFERRRQTRQAQAVARQALAFSAHCEHAQGPHVARLALPAGLTRREFEIARLAAAGHSSPEIATLMTLSRRTVESHLYRAYRKLGISDRSTLADVLDRLASATDSDGSSVDMQ